MAIDSRIKNFRAYDVAARRAEVAGQTGLTDADIQTFEPGAGLTIDQADRMVENVIGVIGIPVGIATNFTINGKDYLIPLATEEPSVVAAASNAARIARGLGGFHVSSTQPIMQAQIQVVDVLDPAAARIRLLEARAELIALANEQDPMLVSFGGGVQEVSVRLVTAPEQTYVVLHIHVDVRDAMGANAVNTMAEAIAPRVAEIAGGRVVLRILTNKADLRLTRVRAVFDAELIGSPEVVDNLIHAVRLAECDPYRAATHNKGIMNGISAAVLATGNDTRAVEAGCHSHAVNADGVYSSLSHFEKDADGNIVGTLELPMPVGLVGGATKVHPVAQAAVKMLGVETAEELAGVIMAVGLAQNLAAVRVLAGEGVQRGHMGLHARNIAATAGAEKHEIDAVVARLVADKKIRVEHAVEVLAELRGGN